MNYKELLKYIYIIAIAGNVFPNNACGKKETIGLVTFLSPIRLTQSTKGEAEWQKLHGDKWHEKYFKNPKEAYQGSLRSGYMEQLNNTHLYILVSSYEQAKTYGSEVIKSLEANAKHLMELGVTPHIVVRCDAKRTENEKPVVSGDLRMYAEILNEEKIAFKVHESKGVEPSDFQYEYHKPASAHWEFVANDKNLGCSGTRHASIDMIEEKVKNLRDQGKHVYIGIFDGDDWVHEDFYPVLLLNALYAKKRVSNYNGLMGAHGLEYYIWLRKKRMLGIGMEYTWTVYTNVKEDCVEETLSKEYAELHPQCSGVCCTTKIFEAGYFYGKLNLLWQKKLKSDSNAKRKWINLTELSCLDGFCEDACTCTTTENLFHYTQHK
jgi:hypothetical protein